jgi:2-iminobutanoate/2-iminopropanoate deaminase
MKKEIATDKAPKTIGPYSQGIISSGLIFISGQIPVEPISGTIPGAMDKQAEQAFINLGNILSAGGSGFEKVVKTTIFIQNMADFAIINEVYQKYFVKPFPARSCVEVAKLPKNVLIEVEAIAAV